MKLVLDVEHPSKFIGAMVEDDDQLVIEGCSLKYQSFMRLVKTN